MAPPVLQVSEVSKRFGRQTVLRGLTMDVRPGEVHALVGHNGSGKSTFVKILAGFHRPERGAAATVDGTSVSLGDPQAAQAAGLRFVHQDLGLVENLDAVDNINLGRRYPTRRFGRVDWPASRRQAGDLLDSLGYRVDLRTPVGRLSLLDRTGVAIARALRPTQSPARLLVLDEPTAALPAASVRELFDMITRLRATGIGILYISHHLEEIFTIADRVTVLRDGLRITTRPVAGLTEPDLVELMVGAAVAGAARRSNAAPRGEAVLRARGLRSRSLRELDIDIGSGEIVGVAGVAGSGRDELAGALFGSLDRDGSVLIRGVPLPAGRPHRSLALGLGLLPADRVQAGLVARMSVAENLTLPKLTSSWHGAFLSRRREAGEVLAWLDRLDVRPRDPAMPVSLLSGGNQQKVLLGRWLRAEPAALVLDEPTRGVDVGAIARIYDLVRQFAGQGGAVLVCSSEAKELAALCDRVVVLNHGVAVTELRGDEIRPDAIDRLCLLSAA